MGNSLVDQWLGLRTATAGHMGSISGWETKIPNNHIVQKKKKINVFHFLLIRDMHHHHQSAQDTKGCCPFKAPQSPVKQRKGVAT